MTRWERSNAPVRRSSAIARSTRCCTLAPASQPDEHANGFGEGLGSGDEADVVTGGGGSDVSRAFAAHPARIDERSRPGRHQGADRRFAKTRVEVTGCIRGVGQKASARDDGSGDDARDSDARAYALDARARSLPAAETERARRRADQPTKGGPTTVVAPSPARATGNNVRTRLGHSIKEGPMMRTCAC